MPRMPVSFINKRALSADSGNDNNSVNKAVPLAPMYQVPSPTDRLADVPSSSDPGTNSGHFQIQKRSDTAQCVVRGLRISPQKLNDVAHMIRKLPVDQAIYQCKLSVKKAAKFLEGAIRSAKANAIHNHGMNESTLWVAEAYVGKGRYLKRIMIHGRNKSGTMEKKVSQLTIVLRDSNVHANGQGIPHVRIVERDPGWTRQKPATKDIDFEDFGS